MMRVIMRKRTDGSVSVIRNRKEKYLIQFLTIFLKVILIGLAVGGITLFFMHRMPFFAQEKQQAEKPKKGKLLWEPIEKGEEETKIQQDTIDEKQTEASQKEEGVHYKKARVPGEVTLVFAGDVLFDDSYSTMISLKQRAGGVSDTFSEELLKEMTEADIFMLNNEFTFTERGEPLPDKSYTFRSKPENVKYLFDMGADIVSLANNHTFDFGEVSLLDTVDTLTGAGMPYVGAGRNIEEAAAPVYFEIDGIRFGFLAATQIERISAPPTRGATADSSGVFRCLEPEALYEAVRETKKHCDYLIVFVHWGTEKVETTDWAQQAQGPGLAEAGADLVIGAHPHVLQGLDSAGGVPVVNSLGNFWFNSFELDSCIVKVTFQKEGMKSFQFLPALQKGCYTSLTEGAEKERVLEYIRSLSPNVVIDEDGYVTFM